MSIDIEVIDGFRCSECEEVFEEASDEPLYECPECERKAAGDEARRCEDCRKFCRKIADQSCPQCNEGETEPTDLVRCNHCNEVIDPESGDVASHIAECFADDLREEVAKENFKSAERVEAIKCPWCDEMVEASEEDLVEHMGNCNRWEEEQDPIISAAIEEAEREKSEADRKAAEEAARVAAEKKSRKKKPKQVEAVSVPSEAPHAAVEEAQAPTTPTTTRAP